MHDVYKACGIIIIAIVLTAVLKSQGSAIAKFIPQISSLVILIGVLSMIRPIIEFIKGIINRENISNNMFSVLISATAITLVCTTVYDICKENGENMLANTVGNAQITLLLLPILKELLSKSEQVLGL